MLITVQAQVMPVLLNGVNDGHLKGKGGYRPSDVCCSAPTGSGKTLAFVLPIVQVKYFFINITGLVTALPVLSGNHKFALNLYIL